VAISYITEYYLVVSMFCRRHCSLTLCTLIMQYPNPWYLVNCTQVLLRVVYLKALTPGRRGSRGRWRGRRESEWSSVKMACITSLWHCGVHELSLWMWVISKLPCGCSFVQASKYISMFTCTISHNTEQSYYVCQSSQNHFQEIANFQNCIQCKEAQRDCHLFKWYPHSW